MPKSARRLCGLVFLLIIGACGVAPGNDDDASGSCNLLAGDAQPEVFIDAPDNGDMESEEAAINWLVRIEDSDSEVEDVELLALDLSDGTPQDINFAVPSPDADGRSMFTLSGDTLGSGVIVVRIEATDASGCSGADQVVLCIDVPASECDFE
jgi:hypothetical protein